MRTDVKMHRGEVDFAGLKRSVSMGQVLERYGLLQGLSRCGNNLSGACPLHNGHNKTQFRVSLSKNCWICFGDCHAGGSVLDFVSRMENVTIREAALIVEEWRGGRWLSNVEIRDPASPIDEVRSESPNVPLGFVLAGLDQRHPYLGKRALTRETITEFGLGYCSRGSMKGRIVIPIHNRDGNLVAYAGRWPGTPPPETPKYRIPKGFRKSLELFNAHRAKAADRAAPLVVVEGFFDCIKLWQGGVRSVVALMGSSMSKTQENTICEIASGRPEVVLMLDEDEAGRAGRKQVGKRLEERRLTVRVHEFDSPGQQPDNLPSAEIKKLCLRHRP